MENVRENETLDSADVSCQTSAGRELFGPGRRVNDGEMMGPILRRKKVVSLPLGRGGTIGRINQRRC